MKIIKLKGTESNDLLVNVDNILYCTEHNVYNPSNRSSYLVTKIVFGNETTINVAHTLSEVKHLIELE